MGRSRSSSRSSTRSRSSSPASSSSSSSSAAKSQKQSTPQQTHQQPAPTPQYAAPQGPGLMTQIAANAASIAGGHVLAHTIIGAMEGRGGERGSPELHQAAAPAASSADRCAGPYRAFNDCMKESENDISLCQWAFDSLKRCQGSS